MANRQSPENAKAARQRERNISLKKYYGLGSTQDSSPRPLDIDDITFNSSKYFSGLLREKPLCDLLEEDNKLMTGTIEMENY
ncbi:hypothetical protein DFQ28_011107 [Apophysomyces sp. BC1034]|nr:hypothetical protein DFQ29_007960 [Apophysomyces sp. BC1021]KAG0191715.1 hypothetical protein DFQ28_011107 [Apophysomyces sp. BC1034]